MAKTKNRIKNSEWLGEVIVLKKNQTSEVRIGFKKFWGKPYLDIRIYTKDNATKKGVTFQPTRIRALIAALEKATEAHNLALPKDEPKSTEDVAA